MQYISQLPWPKLTEEQARQLVDEFDRNKQYSKKVVKSSGRNLTRADYEENSPGYFNLSQWPNKLDSLTSILNSAAIKSDNLGQIGVQCSVGELPPHTDFARTLSAICVLEGPADTTFYQTNADAAPAQIFAKANLIEVQRFRLELNTWYLFNNAAIHGVDNYQGRRLSLSIDLTPSFDSYEMAWTHLSNTKGLFL